MGSLLLTPQENESLFTFLGKKCVVSGRDPCRRPRRYLTGSGLRAGKWEGGRRRERRGEGPAAGRASSQPGSLGMGSAGRGGRTPPPEAAREQGSVTSAALSWNPAWPGPGLRPCCWFKLCSQATRGFYSCTSCSILKTGPLYWPSLHLLLLDPGVPSLTMAEVSGVDRSGNEAEI